MEKGMNPKGYLVCKFAFKVRVLASNLKAKHIPNLISQRLPNQPPLPVRASSDDKGAVVDSQAETPEEDNEATDEVQEEIKEEVKEEMEDELKD